MCNYHLFFYLLKVFTPAAVRVYLNFICISSDKPTANLFLLRLLIERFFLTTRTVYNQQITTSNPLNASAVASSCAVTNVIHGVAGTFPSFSSVSHRRWSLELKASSSSPSSSSSLL